MGGFRLDVLAEYWPLFVEGAEITIELTIGCVFFGIILGMILGMARMASARHDPWKTILSAWPVWPVPGMIPGRQFFITAFVGL